MTKVNPPAALILPKISFPTLGWTLIDWIEEFLVHGRGDVQSGSSSTQRSASTSAGGIGLAGGGAPDDAPRDSKLAAVRKAALSDQLLVGGVSGRAGP